MLPRVPLSIKFDGFFSERRAGPGNGWFAAILIFLMLVSCWVPSCAIDRDQDTPSLGLAEALSQKGMSGEPYDLAGKRMVFTNWYFIRPGNLLWLDEKGEQVNTLVNGDYGPWDAQISRPSSPYGIEIQTQSAERGGRLEREKPWEAEWVRLRTIFQEGGRYRAWGQCQPGGHCYFESEDGIHWERPELELVDFEGSRRNNLLPAGPPGCVFVDPSAPPEQRYKSVGGGKLNLEQFEAFRKKWPDKWEPRGVRLDKDPPEVKTLLGATSPDGIHWNPLPEVLTAEHSDGMESGYFDQRLRKYILFTRSWYVGPRSMSWTGDPLAKTFVGESHGSGRRCIGISISERFSEFPVSQPLIVPTAADVLPSEVFYTSPYTTIPGAPDHHLLIPSIWDTRDDTTSLGLWSSWDGLHWERVPGPRLFETADFGQWDGGCFWAFPNLYERADGSWVVAYRGYNLPHKYPRAEIDQYTGFMAWPKGRMVAVTAKEIGEFATVGIIPPGRKLQVNALTKRAGGIRVEIATLSDMILPGRSFEDCDPVQGDCFWSPVTWNGEADIGYQEGQGIILRFRMDRAKLFGVQFE